MRSDSYSHSSAILPRDKQTGGAKILDQFMQENRWTTLFGSIGYLLFTVAASCLHK
jgi:hypothetical protein